MKVMKDTAGARAVLSAPSHTANMAGVWGSEFGASNEGRLRLGPAAQQDQEKASRAEKIQLRSGDWNCTPATSAKRAEPQCRALCPPCSAEGKEPSHVETGASTRHGSSWKTEVTEALVTLQAVMLWAALTPSVAQQCWTFPSAKSDAEDN